MLLASRARRGTRATSRVADPEFVLVPESWAHPVRGVEVVASTGWTSNSRTISATWKAAQVVRALLQEAAAQSVTIATATSLKTMLSKWENGHTRPDPVSQRLLCRIYGQSPEELGLRNPDGPVIHLTRLPPAVGAEMVEYFKNVFAEHLRADNLMGPHHLVDVVRAQTVLLDQMLPSSRGTIREDLLKLAFRYNEFAGWLYQDAGDPYRAMHYTDRSSEYALEIGNTDETAYVLMRKADIAADLDSPDRAARLAQAALREPGLVSPRVRALVLRLRGRAYAQFGDAGECARSLDAAVTEVARPNDGPDGLTDYCTPSYIAMETAACWGTLGRFDAAVTAYERGLQGWPDGLRRDQGLCLARLANAYAGREDVDQACSAGRQAVDVIRAAMSSRALSELQRVRVRLAPWRRHAEVSDLSDRIRGLLHPAAQRARGPGVD
ncbi:MAG TPA: hypothetical protein VGR24_13190 [bacterium]|nr:hypothetical protein [bacterium]